MKEISRLKADIEGKSPEEILQWASETFGTKAAFASSLGLEDQVITDMISRHAYSIPTFTLDTGRLFPEAYDLIEQTEKRYGTRIQLFFPNNDDVEAMVSEHGLNLFFRSVELRKLCCRVRKIDPLKRALSGLDAWICGLRREQAVTRHGLEVIEWDSTNGLIKINPLADWTEPEVRNYIRENNVPYNPLHDVGFPSIGCACCTRAVKAGEDARTGRWWWEQPEQKECGLHLKDGKLARTK